MLVGVAVVIAVVVIITLFSVGLLGQGGFSPLGPSHPSPEVVVGVLTLNFAPSNNPCFGSDYQTTATEKINAGGELLYNVSLRNGDPSAARNCTVTGLTVGTPGFTLLSSNLPVTVPSAFEYTTVQFALRAPDSAFNGSVLVSANMTYVSPDIEVTAQNFSFTGGGGACGSLSASGVGFSGFSGSTYSDSALVISVSPLAYCNLTQITVAPGFGFSISGSNLPLALPLNSFASVTFTLGLPSSAYSGTLEFTLTVTAGSA